MPKKRHSRKRSSRSYARSMCWSHKVKPVAEAVRSIAVTEVTYYRWRQEYGGLKGDQVKRLKDLEAENTRLRRFGIGSDAGKADPERGRLGNF